MANKPCTCGSEAIPGKPPEIIIRLRDIQRGNFAIGNLLPLSHSPIFLSLASDFCASSPRSNYQPKPGLSSYLFNREINRVWAERCRCKRELGTWKIEMKIIYRVPGVGSGNFDNFTSTNIAGAVVNTRFVRTQVKVDQVRLEVFGYTAASNYTTEVSVARSEQGFLRPQDSYEYGGFTQVLVSPGCPPSPPSPSTPSSPIAYPTVPRSPNPDLPPKFYIPEPPKKRRFGMPPLPPDNDCCDCC